MWPAALAVSGRLLRTVQRLGGRVMHYPVLGLAYSVSGFGVGLLVGLTGVGGGSLMTPILLLLFGLHPSAAVGTDLLYAAATKTAGTFMHGARKSVDWRIVGRLAAGSVPGALATLAGLSWLGLQGHAASRLIELVLGAALILTAVAVLLRSQIVAFVASRFGEPDPRRIPALTVATGLALGVLVTISSVGAGAVGVTVLVLLYPRLPTARIVGSDIAHAVPLTLLAGVGHWLLGSVDWGILGVLLTGSIPGILLGGYLATRVPDLVLRPLLATTLVLVGSRLVM